ncbi:MAG: acetyl-CoA carboxylase biotin carboxylase subunit [Bacteroidetes bacterium]|nr:acetyl-CoA carboxylase biotin carboxylase subunit [Bacteroidota bacterium]
MKKILIANRGEIALRVMQTARKMGIKAIAVYSEADRESPHVHFADEAVCIGKPPSASSYLDQEKIIRIAKELGADGIHPGYGFLSENAEFAQAVKDNGFIFIGPSPHSIRVMGSKLEAKKAVKNYDIPQVPGTEKAIDDPKQALTVANEIGYPILIKASAGGGGKGMRIVHRKEDFIQQMERAVSEAESAFGDGSVFIEKYLESPRHIEIQILADNHGNVVHLFERECSIQRRHQKVIEEAPSSILTPEIREKMGRDAINVARSCNYSGAGTVEFLVDDQLQHYFLEMNTRLQVEHPVTEMITGLDLVEQQIEIARGGKLSFQQEDIQMEGHALELRVYAEDPLNSFLPSIGVLENYKRPSGRNIRVDDGYEVGMEIPIYYDPLISKLVTYGATRQQAIKKMLDAIEQYDISGIATSLPFGTFVCKHDAFISGNFDTHFVDNYYYPSLSEKDFSPKEAIVASTLAVQLYENEMNKLKVANNNYSKWKER